MAQITIDDEKLLSLAQVHEQGARTNGFHGFLYVLGMAVFGPMTIGAAALATVTPNEAKPAVIVSSACSAVATVILSAMAGEEYGEKSVRETMANTLRQIVTTRGVKN